MRSVLVCLLLTACAGEDSFVDDEVEVGADDDGKADADSELRVRTGDTTVWMTKTLARKDPSGSGDNDVFTLRGHASRTVTDGMGFVFDDPYGDFAKTGTRSFEVSWPVSTARTLVDGTNQFVRLQFPHSNGRPDSLTARAIVRPRLGSFTGSPSVYVTAELTPVVVDGEVVYRAHGKTSTQSFILSASVGGVPHAIRRIDNTQFELDLSPREAFAIAGLTTKIEIFASLESGNVTKQATLGLSLKKLALTAGDVYEKFPRPDCDDATKSCLGALPDGATDLASCGEAVVTLSCAGRLGLFVQDTDVQAAIAKGIQITSSTAFRSDAAGLVGADRVEQLVGGAEQTIDDRASQVFGRWLLSATARDAVLARAVDGSIHAAYARPLELVEPHAPVPGDVQAERHVAADALLAELAKSDFVTTEFARSYDALVDEFRAVHVQSLREMRETSEVGPYPGTSDLDVVVGQWLGTYVEVSISKATGEATHTLIEID